MEVYESLLSNTACELRWFCDPCLQQIASQRDCITEKLDAISKKMENLVDRMQSIGARLDSETDWKSGSTVTVKLDVMNKKFENLVERFQAIETRLDTKPDPALSKPESRELQLLEEAYQKLEHKVDQLCTNMDELVALAVQGALQQDMTEELEIENASQMLLHMVWLNRRTIILTKEFLMIQQCYQPCFTKWELATQKLKMWRDLAKDHPILPRIQGP